MGNAQPSEQSRVKIKAHVKFTAGALKEVPLGCIYLILRGDNFPRNADIGPIGHYWLGISQLWERCDKFV